MQLKDRKRINNIPRFNSGFDSNLAFSSILNTQGQNQPGLGSNLMTNSYFNNNGTNNILNMDYTRGAASNIKLPKQGFKTQSGLISEGVYSGVKALGDAFSQSGKFTDSTSNDIRNYGGIISRVIPGKYGKLAEGAVDIASDTIGMYKYHHNNDQMMNEVGTTERTINGIGYTTQNDIDTAKSYSDVKNTGVKNALSMGFKGSAAGFAVGGPIGAVVGGVLGNVLGIFGGRRAAIRQGRINRNAIKQNSLINAQQKAYANSQGLVNNYYANNDNTTDDILYANRGKDLRLRKRINNKRK